VGDVAGRPGAKGRVQPGEGEDAEQRSRDFVEKLFEGAPETAKALLAWGLYGA
jgi:hypothetical protein